MSSQLPANPNLEHLKNQAKASLRTFEQGDSIAKERFASLAAPSVAAGPKLADALHAVALEYGFTSWPKLKEHVKSLTRILSPDEKLSAAIRASDAERTARVLEEHPELKDHLDGPLADYGAGTTPLLAAVQRSDHRTIEVLLRAGADINARSHLWAGGLSVLDECAHEMAPFLMERGAVLDVHAAARLGWFQELQELVESDP